MKKHRYKFGNGLAHYEGKDVKMLEDMASQGYAFEKVNMWGFYKFRAAQVEECAYSIDFSCITQKDEGFAEYLEIFNAGGWEYVTSIDCIHYFKAPKGTKPIYTDGNSMAEKYEKKQMISLGWVIIAAIFIVVCVVLYIVTSLFFILMLAGGGIGICAVMFQAMQQNKKWAARLREGASVADDYEEMDSAEIYDDRRKSNGRSLIWSIISVVVTTVLFGLEFFGIIPFIEGNAGTILATIIGAVWGVSIYLAISSAIGLFKNKRKAAERREEKC